ncbi:MAG: hypothetical protein AAB481_03210 [Patescibacteria group bacterium]
MKGGVMKYMFTLNDGYDFDRGDVTGHAYLTHEQFRRMSAAVFRCNGRAKTMKSLNSDRLYIVTQGEGTFYIGKNNFDVHKDDIVIVPRNTTYSYAGTMTCFLVHSPAFDKTKEVQLEK